MGYAYMSRIVYLENWQEQLELAIGDVNDRLISNSTSSENYALMGEIERLEELVRQVRDVSPEERAPVQSVVLPLSVREPLELPAELVSRLGDLFDIYRRFRTRLSWEG